MNRIISIVFSLLVGIAVAYSQGKIWSGDLEVQGFSVPLIFHLDEDNPTVDSPEQGAKGIPVQILRVAPDSIIIQIPSIGANFVGKYGENEIAGTYTQNGIKLPLTLVQGVKTVQRPQTPKPPYPYLQEEVGFSNGDAELKGTLTMPEGYTKETPVVLMVTGSGLQNRDEEIYEHKPFAVIADALARNSIASLRYDDRGFGESTGDVVNCTTEDLKNDALAGIDLLREKFDKVGVLGHSEGGTIALMLGAEKKADFIISLAGMAVSGKELLLDQNRHLLTQAGYPSQVVDEYCDLLALAFDGDRAMLSKLESSYTPTELKQNLQVGLSQLDSPYMQYFLKLDVRDRLKDISCPVLALNGTKDTQVSYKDNLEAVEKGLPSNTLNKVLALEGLNHMLQHCKTGSPNEYATIEETISPEVLEIICKWIKSFNNPF